MKLPDARHHNTDPAFAAKLMTDTGMTQRELAERVDVAERTLRCYKTPDSSGNPQLPMPYAVQYALESIVDGSRRTNRRSAGRPDRTGRA